ncbi:uncharacterized protein LOC131948252 [Physella acuta]|uniref:uncharacterized protein LOC131948252 n=1 Tax=Physella acuta TaxID=109671 RepID=UPI0027DB557A|nr:uncharacterized protein LOC131948252 [Physella acuta]
MESTKPTFEKLSQELAKLRATMAELEQTSAQRPVTVKVCAPVHSDEEEFTDFLPTGGVAGEASPKMESVLKAVKRLDGTTESPVVATAAANRTIQVDSLTAAVRQESKPLILTEEQLDRLAEKVAAAILARKQRPYRGACYGCGSRKHFVRDCPRKAARQRSQQQGKCQSVSVGERMLMRVLPSSQPKFTPPRSSQCRATTAQVTSPSGWRYGCRVFRRGGGLQPEGAREEGRQPHYEYQSQREQDRRLGDRHDTSRGRRRRRRRGRRRGGRRRGWQRPDYTMSSAEPTVAEGERRREIVPTSEADEGEELTIKVVVPTGLRPEATPFVPEVVARDGQDKVMVRPAPHLDEVNARDEASDEDDSLINPEPPVELRRSTRQRRPVERLNLAHQVVTSTCTGASTGLPGIIYLS